ncbi:nicotinamide mononucleotide transporter [Dysgonomonas hofstadii]|uniref:Nicotinamide riboside transporter PnuC n=1 Tax=Dysgonomonas hofstadii TaxID=637886 RepID=A0A840CN75_9BACT|nr:nicotinamide riboside transporter PnuC [Dysgonomonas hofstadii]MBB4036139.1 nicotinamide mononucleotide transporter [Dysgonomonas hofstadii]
MTDFLENNWISIAGAAIGLIFLYLEYKASKWMWAASIIMAAFFIYIYYRTELYASMGIYIYFFFASVYGWIMWLTRNREENTGDDIISQVDKKYIPSIIGAIFVVAAMIYLILIRFSGNYALITIGDALSTALNIVALWMISRKWAEQWLLVIPANLISGILLFAQHDIMSGSMFIIYFIVSIFGYRNWRRMIKAS